MLNLPGHIVALLLFVVAVRAFVLPPVFCIFVCIFIISFFSFFFISLFTWVLCVRVIICKYSIIECNFHCYLKHYSYMQLQTKNSSNRYYQTKIEHVATSKTNYISSGTGPAYPSGAPAFTHALEVFVLLYLQFSSCYLTFFSDYPLM